MNRKHKSPSLTFPRLAGGAIGLLLLVACTTTAVAQSSVDRIRRRTGVDSGKITDMSVLAVTISKGGVESDVPVEEIRSIRFAGEPSELNSARSAISRGREQRQTKGFHVAVLCAGYIRILKRRDTAINRSDKTLTIPLWAPRRTGSSIYSL